MGYLKQVLFVDSVIPISVGLYLATPSFELVTSIFLFLFQHPLPTNAGANPQNEGLSKEEIVNKLKSSIVSTRIVSACENGSTMRLTIRLSKKEAASLLGIDGQEVMKKLVASFSLSTMEKKQQKLPEWKPSLEPIAENLSFALHRSTSTET